jgi:hypothetical protein
MHSQRSADELDHPACTRELRHIAQRDHAYASAHRAREFTLRTVACFRHGHLRRLAMLADASSRDSMLEVRA